MLPECVLLAGCVIIAFGKSLRKEDYLNEKDLSDLQLLLPIKYEESPEWRTDDHPGRLGLLSDGPFSRIPEDEFILDNGPIIVRDGVRKKTTKKDLSHHSRTVPPTDLAENCLTYLFQKNMAKSGMTIENKKQNTELERDMLGALCQKYLGKLYAEEGHTPKGDQKGQIGLAGNLAMQGTGGLAGNLGVGGQGGVAGNVAVDGTGGVFGNVGLSGQGGYAGDVGVNGQGGYADNVFAGFDRNEGNSATGLANGGLGPVNWFDGLSGVGNAAVDGHGGLAGNLGMNGFGSAVGNGAFNGQGGVAGNAAFNGYGGLAGNLGVKGAGGHVGNLGVGGTGGLFGNVGIGGKGGFFGNVGIGTEGNQQVDIYHGHPGNFVNYLLSQIVPNLNNNLVQKQPLPSHALGQNGRGVNFVLNHASASVNKPVELVGVGLLEDAKAESLSAPGSKQPLELYGGLKNNTADKLKSTESDVTENVDSSEDKAVARNKEAFNSNQCLVGSLAYGGTGGQVGNLAVGGGSSGSTRGTTDEHCPHCLHVIYVGLRSDQTPKDPSSLPKPSTEKETSSKAPQRELGWFRPVSGRRDWIEIGGTHNEKLRQYVNSKKPWVHL